MSEFRFVSRMWYLGVAINDVPAFQSFEPAHHRCAWHVQISGNLSDRERLAFDIAQCNTEAYEERLQARSEWLIGRCISTREGSAYYLS